MAYPFLNVEPRHYRFRILNAAQSRFYNLQLYYADATQNPDGTRYTEADLTKPGPKMIQIGTEGGFLPFPVALNDPPAPFSFTPDPLTGEPIPSTMKYTMLLGPAERADVIIDFSKVAPGAKLILYNDAPAPFPTGDPAVDYQTIATGPNTRTLMQFRVVPRIGGADPPSLNIIPSVAVRAETLFGQINNSLLPVVGRLERRLALRTRDLTLNETFDRFGRLIQLLGTNVQNSDGFGLAYSDTPTERVKAGTTEIWRIFNTTGDTHPIHFHLVNVQVLSRRSFDPLTYTGDPNTALGPARRPNLNEMGWKETVQMHPGEVTEVIMKFDLPKIPFDHPAQPEDGRHEYVWHCHILGARRARHDARPDRRP